jgi:hypothetical protein
MKANGGGEDFARLVRRTIREAGFEDDKKHFNPFSRLARNLCTVRLRTVEGLSRPKGPSLRLALVSMPEVPFQEKKVWSLKSARGPAGVDPEAWRRVLVSFSDDGPTAMLAAFREALATALEELASDIVCVSELGFPSRSLVPLREAKQLAHRLSARHQALIVAGSTHDVRTLSNTGYLFFPGCPPEGVTFHKAVSALSVGERISAPAPRQVPVVEIFGLRVAAMICLDIADYASLTSVVRVADRVDMILVPCYTKKFEKMVDIARVASRALPGLVALVNADLADSAAGRCHVARFGTLDRQLGGRQLPAGAVVSLLEIDHEEFQSTRIRMKISPENDMEWLFGSRDRPDVYA